MRNPVLANDLEDIFSRDIDWLKLDGKTILLTGAYGMLASYIVYFLYYLHEEKRIDVSVIAVVRNKEKFLKKMPEMANMGYFRVVESDLKDELNIEGEIDFIIHAASLASPQYYAVCPVDVLLPNTIGTYYLLNIAVKKKVQGFLMFSSVDIYGSIDADGLFDEQSIGTLDTLDIHNCYSESKRLAETMCKAYSVQYGVPVKIARIAHTYAPTMDIKNDPRVFSSFVKNIVNMQNIEMKSDGSSKRTFCYITDAIAGYFAILLKGNSGEAYNVCNTSQYLSVKELAECLVSIYPERNLHVIRKQREKSEHYTENSLLVSKQNIPDNTKLMKLGWEPRIDIVEGFDRVIKYLEYEGSNAPE